MGKSRSRDESGWRIAEERDKRLAEERRVLHNASKNGRFGWTEGVGGRQAAAMKGLLNSFLIAIAKCSDECHSSYMELISSPPPPSPTECRIIRGTTPWFFGTVLIVTPY